MVRVSGKDTSVSETDKYQRGENASRDQKRAYGFVSTDRLYRYVYETQQRPIKRIKRGGR